MLKSIIAAIALAQFTFPLNVPVGTPLAGPAFVNHTFDFNGGTSGTVSIACAAGHSAVIYVWSEQSNTETMTLTTATGNTLTTALANTQSSVGMTVKAWVINNCNGTTGNYTYGDTSTTFPLLSFNEISGANISGILNGTPTVSFGSAFSSTSCSLTFTAPGVMIGQMGSPTNISWIAPAGYTQKGTNQEALFYRAGLSSGAQTYPAVTTAFNTTDNMAACVGVQ